MEYSKSELLQMEPIEVYKLRLEGKIAKFPNGFFSQEVCVKLIKYLIEKKLKWNEEDICKNLSQKTFKENEFLGMLELVYARSPYRALNDTYPGKFKPWQLKNTPKNYWNKDTSKEAIRWLIEEKLKWSDKDICRKLSLKTFIENGLLGMLSIVFNYSPYEAINYAYPGKFKPWQLNQAMEKYWNEETGKEALKWLIEEKLKWNDEDICQKLSTRLFRENGLSGMLRIVFKGSPYVAINSIYPERFKPWQLKNVPKSYWNKETAKEAVKWLIEEKLKWNEEDICQKLSTRLFRENGLYSLLINMYNSSPYEAINSVYPGKYVKVGYKFKVAK